jgi:RNA polymerase sigma-B factor
MHVTRPVQERYLKVTAAADELATSLGRPATVKELAAKTGIDLDDVVEALDAGHGYSPPSLDAPVGGEWGEPSRTLGDTVGSAETGYERVELGEAIGPAFRRLPEREQAMLRMRFLEDLTQSEIAVRCGVSQMHVSRLLRRSLNALLEAAEAGNEVPAAAFG